MSLWTWVLLGLCAAGVLLALAPVVPVVRLLLRVRARVNALEHSRLFTSLESLQLQNKRLEHVARQAAPLARRAQSAVEQMRSSGAVSNEMRDAMESAGAEMAALVDALR